MRAGLAGDAEASELMVKVGRRHPRLLALLEYGGINRRYPPEAFVLAKRD